MASTHLFWPALAVAVPLSLASPCAQADADDTINLTAGATVQHDSNLFRLSSGVDPQSVLGKSSKSDQLSVTSVGLKVNKPYSGQRFELEATLLDYRYRTFDYLSFTARNYAAAWRWSATPYLHGNLTSTRTEALNSFTDYTGYTTRNVRTDERHRLDGVFEIDGAWRLVGGLAEYNRTNSQLFTQEGDNRVNTAELGLRREFRSGSALTYTTKSGRGEYMNRPQPIVAGVFDNRFDDRENEVRLFWALTGKATLDARAAHFERTHAHFSQRDYGGNVGNLNLNWEITAKTRLTASLAREMSSYQTATSSYSVADRFAFAPYWQFGTKTTLRARYDYARLDYRGALIASPLGERSDTLRSAMIGLEWQPLRTLSLSASLQNDQRTSSQPGLDYDAKIANVSAQVSF